MDILSFKYVKDRTESALEHSRRDLYSTEITFLESLLAAREHLDGDDLKRWRRIMRTV